MREMRAVRLCLRSDFISKINPAGAFKFKNIICNKINDNLEDYDDFEKFNVKKGNFYKYNLENILKIKSTDKFGNIKTAALQHLMSGGKNFPGQIKD